jgi:outer membrane protein assembly factor BamB
MKAFRSLAPLALVIALPLLGLPAGTAEDLWAAARQGDTARVAELLAHGVDPNAEFRAGGTALLFAAQRGHAEVVRLLLDHGADLRATEKLNQTSALHFATGYPEVVKILVERGADVNARELQKGQTPLWWAVARKDPASAQILIASGRMSRQALLEAAEQAKRSQQSALVAQIEQALAGTEALPPRWPQFRGEAASGVAEGAHPPLAWTLDASTPVKPLDASTPVKPLDAPHLKWKVEIPGLGHSSPIVWGDRVCLTTAVSSQPETDLRPGSPMESAKDMSAHSLRVLCLDRRSGRVLWERTAYQGIPRTKRSPKNSFATPTPATDGKHLVAMFGSHGLYCFDLDGKLLWKVDLGLIDAGFFYDPEYQWGDASSPILYKNMVIVQCDMQKGSFLAAFDLDTGERRWKTLRDELPAWSTPTLDRGSGRPELITNGVNGIRGYDPDTGKERWFLKTANSMVVAPTPVAGLGLIVVTNGYRPLKPIYAIRSGATGDISLGDESTNRSVAWSKKSGGSYYITPLLYGEHLYVLTEDGILTNYYLKTGEQIYRQRVGKAGDAFSASPVAADGYLFLASEGGEVYVVKEGIEFQLVATNPVGELCMATPAIVDGMLFVRTRSHLLAFG